MTSLRLDDDDDAALYTLAYFTSAWVQPVDGIVLPRLRAVLDAVNARNHEHQLIGMLEVRRTDESSDAKVQRLEPSYATIIALQQFNDAASFDNGVLPLFIAVRTFRSLCKHFQVTDLPACVLLDAQGQALAQESLRALEVAI